MKKFLALLLTLALLAGLTACKDTEAASTAQEQHTVTAVSYTHLTLPTKLEV